MDDVHFSSETNEWATPQDFFDKLNDEFHFTLDPCSTDDNCKCEKHYTIRDNGLQQDWSNDVVFMNPPYGRDIDKWIRKAYGESLRGAIVVCLIPARTDTSYWHDYIFNKSEIRFIRGRLSFGDGKNPAPFPSAVIIYNNKGMTNDREQTLFD